MTTFPLIEKLSSPPSPLAALNACADLPYPLLMESALERTHVGRYTFLTADPYRFWEPTTLPSGVDPFAEIRRELELFPAEPIPDLPPFQGGAAGVLSYDSGGAWERLPHAARDEFRFPAMAVGLYDWVLAWDHATGCAWLISHGTPETDPLQRERRARDRIATVRDRLSNPAQVSRLSSTDSSRSTPIPRSQLAASVSLDMPGLLSNFSREGYLETVSRAIEYIAAGDIFQVNLSQRLLYPQDCDPRELYTRLRARNPAPFAAFFQGANWSIVSASPERFVSVRDRVVETRPIKGTRRRASGPEADLFTRDALRESVKDQAENVMIVDLLRNDLSRVCKPGAIRVPQLCAVETYETVQHLVSEVRGELQAGKSGWDLLAASFPGGSITGAPKVRAMEIIAELEPTARGAYCGSLFYIGYDGQMDSSILIRTFTVSGGWVQCPVGGGIVAQSDPEAEYQETLHKAEGMLRALVP